MNTLFIFIFWFILLIFGSRFVDRMLAEIFPKGRYRWIIWPGVVIHELSHALVGKLMGAQIKDISLFSKTGGSVTHTKPRMPIIGMPLTSIAPLFGCTFSILGLLYLFGYQNDLSSFFDIFSAFQKHYAEWKWWLFIYLTIAIATPIAPSNHDFKNSWFGIVFILIVFGAFFYFHIGEDFLKSLLQSATSLFTLGVIFEFLAAVVVLPFWLIRRNH